MKQSLRLKLLYSFMLVIVLIIIGVSVGVSLLIKGQMISGKQRELVAKGYEIAQGVRVLYQQPGDTEALEEFLSGADRFLGARVWVVDSSQQVVAMSSAQTPMGMGWGKLGQGRNRIGGQHGHMRMGLGGMGAVFKDMDSVFQGKVWTRTYESPFYGEQMIMAAVPFAQAQGAGNGAVVLHAPVTGINEAMRQIYYYIGAVGLAAVIMALMMVSRLTRSIVRPLRDMEKTAQDMAKGDYSSRVTVNGEDEVGRLGKALNSLAHDLERNIAELNQMEKLRRDFVANVSHELRTPLTIIRGYNEALLDGTVEPGEDAKTYYHLIGQETQRLERLIQDLLDLSRLQSQQLVMEKEWLPLPAIAEGVVNMMAQRAARQQVSLLLESQEDLPLVWGNGDRITQLLLIFLDNGLKYTLAGGTLTVSLTLEEKGVCLQVADTGAGIPPEDVPYIWERFYKADKSHSRLNQGTGLGLAIARQILELHGATVEVSSQVGQGTVFSMYFPVKKE